MFVVLETFSGTGRKGRGWTIGATWLQIVVSFKVGSYNLGSLWLQSDCLAVHLSLNVLMRVAKGQVFFGRNARPKNSSFWLLLIMIIVGRNWRRDSAVGMRVLIIGVTMDVIEVNLTFFRLTLQTVSSSCQYCCCSSAHSVLDHHSLVDAI